MPGLGEIPKRTETTGRIRATWLCPAARRGGGASRETLASLRTCRAPPDPNQRPASPVAPPALRTAHRSNRISRHEHTSPPRDACASLTGVGRGHTQHISASFGRTRKMSARGRSVGWGGGEGTHSSASGCEVRWRFASGRNEQFRTNAARSVGSRYAPARGVGHEIKGRGEAPCAGGIECLR